ncbi:MAG: hypothetical protein WC234_04270 [Endomicrobiaceae bacterium]
MNYKYTMGKISRLFLSIRYFLSVWITISLLSVSFLNLEINNNIKTDINNIYQATSMSDYYKFITAIPIKLVSKFIITNTNDSSASSDTHNNNNNNKENKNGNNTVFINTSSANVKTFDTLNSLDKNFMNYSRYIVKFDINCNYFYVFLFAFLIILLSSGMLARGNIDDNIKINNMKKLRLVE